MQTFHENRRAVGQRCIICNNPSETDARARSRQLAAAPAGTGVEEAASARGIAVKSLSEQEAFAACWEGADADSPWALLQDCAPTIDRKANHLRITAPRDGRTHMKRALTRTLTRTAAAIICLALALAAACLNPAPAHAVELRFDNGGTAVLNDDGSITGTCSTVVTFVPFSMDDVDHFDVYMPDGQIVRGYCVDYGLPTPANATYSFTATPVGDGGYNVLVESGFAEWVVHTDGSIERGAPDRSQRVGRILWYPKFVLKGSISLTKESAAPAITEGNDHYSLEGAVYGVFANRQDAEAGDASKAIATYTTDETGTWTSGKDFEVGDYFIGEIAPPRGYERNAESLAVTVLRDENTQVQAADTPITVPIDVQTKKTDADTGEASAQGNATLAGAEITFCYYAGRYDASNLPAEPTRTWVMKTDESGTASLAAGPAMQVAGDEFFYDAAGNVVVPFGTVTATETKAPDGYVLNANWKATCGSNENTTDDILLNLDELVGKGALTVVKTSRHLEAPGPAGDGSLAGARFEVVNESTSTVMVNGAPYQQGEVVLAIETDGDGVAATDDRVLPVGSYLVRETRTSERGYLLDEASREWSVAFSIEADGQRVVIGPDGDGISNDEVRGNVALRKVDAETGLAEPQGDATLAGATYAIVNKSASPVPSPQTGAQAMPGEVVCTIVTDENGFASTTASNVNGWEIPADFNGKALAYGTYVISEVEPPLRGYLADDDWAETFTIREDGQVMDIAAADPIGRGGAIVGKTSRETASYIQQGAGSLEGWTFEIVNRSDHPVLVDGAKCAPGDVVAAITTERAGDAFVAATGERSLPFGTYEVREVGPAQPGENGYLYDAESEAWSRVFEIAEDGAVVDLTGEADACPNQVVRGDLELVKAKGPEMNRLAGIPFKVTSTTTGEWHVMVTDRNGQASTAADFNPHTARTNANDEALSADGAIDESKLDETAGMWFDGCAEAATEPDDGKGALPYDTYSVEELPVQANAGLDLVSFEVAVFRDATAVDVGTVVDTAGVMPRITTSLANADGAKVVAAQADALLVDTVSFNNLDTSREYQVAGELHLVEDGQDCGLVATSERTFMPDVAHGTVEVPFMIDTSALGGCSLVCFEQLFDSEGQLVAEHADVSDEGQTVSVPSIRTTLVDAGTLQHVATGKAPRCYELTDTVAYAGLAPNKAYTVTGTLHDKETGAVVTDARGIPITATRTFTPSAREGSVDVTFAFELGDAQVGSVVAYESVSFHGIEYAVHANIEDEAQTVSIPGIATQLSDAPSGTHVIPCEGTVQLTDTVSYENLVPGRTYTAEATLHDAATGVRIETGDATEGAGDDEPAGRAVFTPDQPAGTIEVAFSVDASSLPGKTVCFERILDESGRIAAVHADIDDEGQTVSKAAISTEMLDTGSESHLAAQATYCDMVDTVSYEGLAPGIPYTVVGILYDKETDKPLTIAGADKTSAETGDLTVERTFTPTESAGSIEVPFAFAGDLSGKTVVAFERVLDADGRLMALHEDIDADGQSVTFPTPPKEEQPKHPEPGKPSPGKPTGGKMTQTGDPVLGALLAFLPAGVIGLMLAALSVRRLERDLAAKAKHGK